jgi:hypothetical protein
MAADTSGILGAQRSHTQVARPSPRTVPRTHLPDHRSIDQATTRTRRSSASIEWPADTWLGQMRKNERADVTTDGQVSLSNGTLQRKRTRYRDAFESKGCQIQRVQTAERQRTSGRSKLFSQAKLRRLMLVPHMGRALTGADGFG